MQRLAGDDLAMVTSEHRKDGILLVTDHSDHSCRSFFTEHTKQNNKDLTPDFGGHFIPANEGQGHWLLLFYSQINFV